MTRTKKPTGLVCVWTIDEDYGNYETACGQSFVLMDGTPSENNMKFCAYCGRILKVPRATETPT